MCRTSYRLIRSALVIMLFISIFQSCGDRSEPRVTNDAVSIDTSSLVDFTDYTEHGTEIEAGDAPFSEADNWPKPAVFTKADSVKLKAAIAGANNVVRDALFRKIVLEMADANEIEWGSTRLSRIPQPSRDSPTHFILTAFESRGVNRFTDFRPCSWGTGSRTTGSVLPCGSIVSVNVDLLPKRTLFAVIGTVVHERVHGFCQKHQDNNRKNNLCDLAYQMGSLAEVIKVYRDSSSRTIVRWKGNGICTSLEKRLRSHGVLK